MSPNLLGIRFARMLVVVLGCSAGVAWAGEAAVGGADHFPLTPGNLLFADRDTIREFTLDGVQVRAVHVPDGVTGVAGRARNLAIDPGGLVHVYNGTFSPWLSTWDPGTGAWSHLRVPGLATAGYVAGGGICADAEYVYATDVALTSGQDQGLVRVSMADGSITRFATDRSYDDVDIGPGGTLYGLDHNQGQIRLFDPTSLVQTGLIQLHFFCTSIAVAPDGSLFGTTYSGGGLRHISPDGLELDFLGTGSCAMTSIDRFENGVIVATGFCGRVFVTDDTLQNAEQFVGDRYGGFLKAIPLSLGNHAPDCSGAVASASSLWPPDHSLVPIEIQGVADPDGDPVILEVTGVTQDEPPNGSGDGDTCPDALLDGTRVWLRAERDGGGDGRVYSIAFVARDGRGGACEGRVSVCVPHSGGSASDPYRSPRRAGRDCADSGQRFDLLSPCDVHWLSDPRKQQGGFPPRLRRVTQSRGSMSIEYEATVGSPVSFSLYDVAGRRLGSVVDVPHDSGTPTTTLVTRELRAGLYFLRVRAGDSTISRTVLIR